MITKPRIIITGASGLIGTELTKYFVANKWYVSALVRNAKNYTNSKYVTYIEYDLTKPVNKDVFKGADYLIHAAYVKRDSKHPNAFDLNIDGAKRLLKISRANKLKRAVFLSSMSADKAAISDYGKQKYAIEKLFSHSNDIILRLGLVIGNGGLIRQIVHFMRTRHIAPLIDSGQQPIQVIGVYDLPLIIDKVLSSNLNSLFMIGTPEVYSYRELYIAIRERFKLRAILLPVPFWLPLYIIRTINFLHLPLGVTEDNLWGLKKLRAYDTLLSLQKIGITIDNLYDILRKIDIK